MTATYTLPPATYAKAVALGRILVDLHFAGELWSIVLLLLLLYIKAPAKLGQWTARCTERKWLQSLLFAAPWFLLLALLSLPIEVAHHHVMLRFGLSIQHWPSWFGDVAKSVAIKVIIGTLIFWILSWRIRRSPRSWWLQSWAVVMLFVVIGVVIAPVVIDPLFNKFEPLAQTDPALVTRLEQVVARSGMSIPPERIFLMRASAKTTESNAYVTGFGASKRVVVWDNIIKSSNNDEIAFIFGHEMGHYVLRHIVWGILFTAALLFLCFWLGARIAQWAIARFHTSWQIDSLQQPAALAVLMLVLSLLQIPMEPAGNAFSRHIEHAADAYGLEAVHGIVPDPATVAASSFQKLGEANLETPERRPFIEWWTYNHPAIADRIAFAATYDPWTGGTPRYFKK